MTTVAAWVRKGVGMIAADSRASDDQGTVQFNTPKLHKVGQSVFGVAGDDWVDVFLEWVRTGKKKLPERLMELELDDVNFSVIELSPNGIYSWNRTFTRIEIKDKEFAIGSGEMVALYAMRVLNFAPAPAVSAAATVDSHTGGPIDMMLVPQKRRKVAI